MKEGGVWEQNPIEMSVAMLFDLVINVANALFIDTKALGVLGWDSPTTFAKMIGNSIACR